MWKNNAKTSLKVNKPTVMDTKDSEEDENPDKQLKRMIIRMIKEIKKDMFENLNEFKEHTNKQLNEFQENTNKWLNEIKDNVGHAIGIQ
jgi:DNA anti-recombination protein RmuC